MADLKDIYDSVTVNNLMGQLSQEQEKYGTVSPDAVYSSIPADTPGEASHYGSNYNSSAPGQSHYGSGYGNPQNHQSPGSGLPTPGGFNAKASWDIAKRAMQAGILPGQTHGSAGTLKDKKYHWEALDPRHRMGNLLETMYEVFEGELPVGEQNQKLSVFFMWLDEACRVCPEIVKDNLSGWAPEVVDNFIKAGVEYMSAVKRMKHELIVQSGKFYQGDVPFDTAAHRTEFSGPGWAIFVVSPSGQWFAGSHILGQLHHSSFLSGKPVMSAGEMTVKNGQLKTITPKSGHYLPTKEQFVTGLRDLASKGVNMNQVQVNVFEKNAGRKKVTLMANGFLANINHYEVWKK